MIFVSRNKNSPPVLVRSFGWYTTLHYSDEISNRQFIVDFAKVADFIEEMEELALTI
jgi:hypothetical protein